MFFFLTFSVQKKLCGRVFPRFPSPDTPERMWRPGTLRRMIYLNIWKLSAREREVEIIWDRERNLESESYSATCKDLPLAGPLHLNTGQFLLKVPDWEVRHRGGEGEAVPLVRLLRVETDVAGAAVSRVLPRRGGRAHSCRAIARPAVCRDARSEGSGERICLLQYKSD